MLDNRLDGALIKFKAESSIAVLLAICISCISCASLVMLQNVYAGSPINVIAQQPFAGSDGKINVVVVVGVVKNNGSMPVEVVLGLNVVARTGGGLSTTIKQPTYGRIIYPSSVSPFKFAVEPSSSVSGSPFILNSKEVLTPYYKVLSLSYSNMPVGSDKTLVGTAKNVSPFDLHNVTILASVHESNGTQIDSVKSQLFPVIRTDQTVAFTAVPDPAIKQNIAYFSCADIDVGTNSTLNTLAIGNGQFIAYQMYGAAQISDLKYDNATDSLVFGIKHYNPDGGPFSLMIPEMSINQPVSVILDGKLYTQASVKMDGKAVHIDFFVPPASHQVQIKTLWQ
ncbi:MAG: hypothetical protein M3P08_20180 [Thermoproteota archaeon]|nr:hypothetical protein [Thermoproteota archaeon]